MADQLPIQSATRIIIRDFDLDEEKAGLAIADPDQLNDRLHFVLRHQVAYLIAHNIDRLKWILYRIDVSEQKLMQALHAHPTDEAPGIIAQMIIDRQVEKAKTRAKFSTEDGPEWKDC